MLLPSPEFWFFVVAAFSYRTTYRIRNFLPYPLEFGNVVCVHSNWLLETAHQVFRCVVIILVFLLSHSFAYTNPYTQAHTHILHSYIDCRRCRAHYTFFQYARKKTILDCTHSPIYHLLCVCGHSLCFRSFCCLVEIINKFDKCIAKTISTAADYYLLLWIAYSSLETHTQCI